MRAKTLKLLSASVVLLLCILALSLGSRPMTLPVARAAAQTSSFDLFLPLLLNGGFPSSLPAPTVFGVEMSPITAAGGLSQMSAASTSWVRRNAVLWSEVEPSQGTRNWSALAGLESELIAAGSNGMRPILIVRSTPGWAMKIPNTACGPISPGALGAFGNFMHDLVARYSVSPYNVKYWEIWNEPDITGVAGDSSFGCWGDPTDATYFGGGYYAQMLQTVYPRIKAADPIAQVLVGGMALDCKPGVLVCTNVTSVQFFKGILANNGGAFFDGVSFHAYDYYGYYYGMGLGQYSNSNWDAAWNTTGPAVIAKAAYIRGILSNYGVTGKYLINTESALLCDSCSNDSTFETTKAYYLAQVYAASMAQGLRANVWYNVFGWRNSGLLNYDFSPRPAYTAFQFARSELRDASFTRDITDYPGIIKGYEFNREGQKIWILWSLDGSSHYITLPAVPLAGWDALGSAVSLADSMTVDLKPLYLEMP